MTDPTAHPEDVTAAADRILDAARTFVVVGASPSPHRASHGVMATLVDHGYQVVPVNPNAAEVLGRPTYARLADVPTELVDVVDIFRRSNAVGEHVDEAIAMGASAVWLQLGLIDHDAAARARAAGLEVVMDRCPAIELRRQGGRGRSEQR